MILCPSAAAMKEPMTNPMTIKKHFREVCASRHSPDSRWRSHPEPHVRPLLPLQVNEGAVPGTSANTFQADKLNGGFRLP